MTPLDDLPPEEHRRRYEALLGAARARSGKTPAVPAPLDPASIISRETIPGGWYGTRRLEAGQALRIVNIDGAATATILLWNASEPTERLNVSDTMKVQWTARVQGGHVLLSDMGRVLAAIIADDCGHHDGLLGGSTPSSNLARYGRPDLRNTRDNFLRAAGKHGLDARDLPPSFALFAPVQTGADGRLRWQDGILKPGQSVDLLAAMDVLVALSSCPHPLDPDPAYRPHPVEAIVFRPPLGADALARSAGPEAARAYENTGRRHAE